jgi:hypothetical protein
MSHKVFLKKPLRAASSPIVIPSTNSPSSTTTGKTLQKKSHSKQNIYIPSSSTSYSSSNSSSNSSTIFPSLSFSSSPPSSPRDSCFPWKDFGVGKIVSLGKISFLLGFLFGLCCCYFILFHVLINHESKFFNRVSFSSSD